jgi:hypothetical protein
MPASANNASTHWSLVEATAGPQHGLLCGLDAVERGHGPDQPAVERGVRSVLGAHAEVGGLGEVFAPGRRVGALPSLDGMTVVVDDLNVSEIDPTAHGRQNR